MRGNAATATGQASTLAYPPALAPQARLLASVLDGKVKLVQPRPYRAFQGWRYLIAKEAPPDLDRTAPGARHMPEQMRRELRELGLL